MLLLTQLLGNRDGSEPAPKMFSEKILQHQAAFPSINLVGFYLVSSIQGLAEGKQKV